MPGSLEVHSTVVPAASVAPQRTTGATPGLAETLQPMRCTESALIRVLPGDPDATALGRSIVTGAEYLWPACAPKASAPKSTIPRMDFFMMTSAAVLRDARGFLPEA